MNDKKTKSLVTINVTPEIKKKFDEVGERFNTKNASQTLGKLLQIFDSMDDETFVEFFAFYHEHIVPKLKNSSPGTNQTESEV